MATDGKIKIEFRPELIEAARKANLTFGACLVQMIRNWEHIKRERGGDK